MIPSDWPCLASPPEDLREHFEAIVIGSGYGAGIAASRLARAGREVCVLERGREIVPGEYPQSEVPAALEMQITGPMVPGGHRGSATGLFDFHANDDINVLVGCGLGGTSLINANVALKAEPRVFDLDCWPPEIKADRATLIEEGYHRARQMLGSNPVPADWPTLPKMTALEQSAAEMGERFYRLDINVTFQDGVNQVGVQQSACTNCGDCVAGCNYGAKNTTLMNYLPDAVNHGAKIFTQIAVRFLERRDQRWIVHCRRLKSGMSVFDAEDFTLSADLVMLGAGTLGSTEILLRSRANGLALSDQVGQGFTGNGDVLGFSFNGDPVINGIGLGKLDPAKEPPVGPCITSVIDMRERAVLSEGMVLEEGSIPGAIASLLPEIFQYGAATELKESASKLGDEEYVKRDIEGALQGAYKGPVNRSQTYLVMTHDDAGGVMSLDNDRLRVDWPGVGHQPSIELANRNLARAAHANGAIYIRNPMWRDLFGDKLVTVHPLGGCCIGESAATGVINHKGQPFIGTSGAATHPGLYVCDGSTVPTSLGVNPLLTISALAERACAILAQERGWTIDYTLPFTGTRVTTPAAPIGVEFTESMKGSVTFDGSGESEFAFVLNVRIADLYAAIKSPDHDGKMIGTVTAPALSPAAIAVTEGIFNLFTVDPENSAARRMQYRMRLSTVEGKEYYFQGFKFVRNEAHGLDMWADTSTLYVTVHQGTNLDAPQIGKGVLRIKKLDFLKQMTTMKINGATSFGERSKALLDFGKFFAGELATVYNPFGKGTGA